MTQQVFSRSKKNQILVANAVTKWRLSQRDGECCNSCKVRMFPGDLTIDHIICRHDGGTDTLANKQLLCTDCHAKKTRVENLARHKQ